MSTFENRYGELPCVAECEPFQREIECLRARVAELEAWKVRAMKVLEKASLPRHYFQSERFGGDGCGFCGNDLRHLTHYRMGESTKSDRDEARALIDAARNRPKP